MTDEMTVSEHEHGIVRVFLVDPQTRTEIETHGTYVRLCGALGITQIDADHIQLLHTQELAGMSVADFLRQGYEVRETDLAEHAFALDGVDDADVLLLVIRSPAFLDRPVTLAQSDAAKLIASLREPDASVTFDPLPNPDPQAVVEDPPQKKPPSQAAMSGRVATIALLVMGLLVVAMIWIAG